jgi:1-deoxy-D-xylulose-5-phosphate synthase
MAKQGLKPVFAVYSSFLQRAYDQVVHDVCLQNLPVTICIDRAGLVGNDGETHQGLLDFAFLQTIPNINILAPKNFSELEKMLEFSVNSSMPTTIRYPRGTEGSFTFNEDAPVVLGKAEVINKGTNIAILAIGKMVERACAVADILKNQGQNITVINMRFLKPIDDELVLDILSTEKNIVTLEDAYVEGGLGTAVSEIITKNNIQGVNLLKLGYPNEFIKHGDISRIEQLYELDTNSIVEKLLRLTEESIL